MRSASPISYFMPAYNAESTVAPAVASIARKIRAGDELVVVDDASTDGTAGALRALARSHPFMRVLSQPTNSGGGAARNKAIDAARHDLLFCLDADNALGRMSVTHLAEVMLSQGADAAAFSTVRYFQRQPSMVDVTHRHRYKPGPFTLADLLGNVINPPASGNYVFTRTSWEKAGGYPEHSGALDTWGFGLRQLATGTAMVVAASGGYFHRTGIDSYWVREERQGRIDGLAIALLEEQTHLIAAGEISRLQSQTNWLGTLDDRPIALSSGAQRTGTGQRLGEPGVAKWAGRTRSLRRMATSR